MSDGARAGLWRGAKGQARMVQEETFLDGRSGEDLKDQRQREGRRGSEEANTVANPNDDNTRKA